MVAAKRMGGRASLVAESAPSHERGAPGVSKSAEFTSIFEAEFGPLFRFTCLLLDDRAEAEEVTQEAFARLFVRLGSVESPHAFLRTAVVNQARGLYRKRDVRRRRQHMVSQQSAATMPADDLADVIAKLPMHQRSVVVLRFYEQRNELEIAEIVGCRPGTVKSRLARALTTIREELERSPQ